MIENGNALVSGILDDARKKADSIIAEAKKEAEEIAKDAKEEARTKVEAEERTINLKLTQLQLKEESARRSVDRLSEIRKLDSAFSAVMDEVGKRIDALAAGGGLRDYLVSWIAEAAIGLDRKKAKVSFSPKAPVDRQMLDDAEALVRKITGADVILSLDEKKVGEIGVIVSSEDSKVSYNNLLSTRIRRYGKDIKKIIQEENAR